MELNIPGEDTPARFVNCAIARLQDEEGEDILDSYGAPVYGYIHNGETYNFMPFQVPWPTSEPGQAPRSSLEIDNMLRAMMPYIDQISGPLDVTIIIAHTAAPEWEEVYTGLIMNGIEGVSETDSLSGDLTLDMAVDDAFPCDTYNRVRYPGMV